MFPEPLPPNKTTIQKNAKKYERDGRSGRRTTTRTQENIRAVWQVLKRNQGRISVRRNGLEILPMLFCRILKKDLRWYPYKLIRCQNLNDGDYERCLRFCQWFLYQCHNLRFLANFVIGDEAGFALNSAVNNHNAQMYEPANQAPDCHDNINDSCQKLTAWVELCGNGNILGPLCFERNVDGQSYLKPFK